MDMSPVFTPQTIAAIIGGFIGGISATINRSDYPTNLKVVLVIGSVIIAAGVCDILSVKIGLDSFWLTLFLGYLIGIPAGNVIEAIKAASPSFGKKLVAVAEGRILGRTTDETDK